MQSTEWQSKDEEIPGVVQTLTLEGAVYELEIQVQEGGVIVGTVWATTPATRWQPIDVDCVLEELYDSVDDAKAALEDYDTKAEVARDHWEA